MTDRTCTLRQRIDWLDGDEKRSIMHKEWSDGQSEYIIAVLRPATAEEMATPLGMVFGVTTLCDWVPTDRAEWESLVAQYPVADIWENSAWGDVERALAVG